MWGWVSAAAVAGAILFGLPILVRGGRRAERRGGGRRYQVRVGPSLPALVGLGLARRLDGLALAAATIAVVVLAVINARG
ncbi:hypothetical protein [Nonomuraea sp. B19D2]|uniref:hypothetical protein n=1 Tax=Nonomuraea sp. B19D2 TaxID=3159561 RepID=UPI0032DA7D16